MIRRKKLRASPSHERSGFFDSLPDDIVISIICKLCSTSRCPSDFISILITCRRLNHLGLNTLVLCKAGPNTLAVKAKNWSEFAHRFMKRCVNAGNIEASYILGMIRFYCLQNRGSGASLMAKAAMKSHAPALYSLALIHFNGSGGVKNNKDLRAGVALCARAAFLGHVDALRELGHCLQDGYGVRQNIAEGHRVLVRANARELAYVIRSFMCSSFQSLTWQTMNHQPQRKRVAIDSDKGTGFGWHPVNRFLSEWFELKGNGSGYVMKMCSHAGCGRPETRRNEFRRCSGCGNVNYCSRACQAHDWKMRHKAECAPIEQWMNLDVNEVEVEVEVAGGDYQMVEAEKGDDGDEQ